MRRFDWAKARPYVSPFAPHAAGAPPAPADPKRLTPVRWSPRRTNAQLCCRVCGRPARALLYRCIHCPGRFDVCAECEADHPAHPAAHVFVQLAPHPRLQRQLEEAEAAAEAEAENPAADAAEAGAPGAEAAGAVAELAAARRGWAARAGDGMEAALMLRWMREPHRTRLRTLLLLCFMVGFMLLFSLLMPRVMNLPQ
jgi:hypothetical protein